MATTYVANMQISMTLQRTDRELCILYETSKRSKFACEHGGFLLLKYKFTLASVLHTSEQSAAAQVS